MHDYAVPGSKVEGWRALSDYCKMLFVALLGIIFTAGVR